MIKLTVIAEDMGDHIGTHVDGDINSRGDLLVYEMAHVLEEFQKSTTEKYSIAHCAY